MLVVASDIIQSSKVDTETAGAVFLSDHKGGRAPGGRADDNYAGVAHVLNQSSHFDLFGEGDPIRALMDRGMVAGINVALD